MRRPEPAWRILGRHTPGAWRLYRRWRAGEVSAHDLDGNFTRHELRNLDDWLNRAGRRLVRRVYLRGVIAEAEFDLEVLGRRAARELQLRDFELPRGCWHDVWVLLPLAPWSESEQRPPIHLNEFVGASGTRTPLGRLIHERGDSDLVWAVLWTATIAAVAAATLRDPRVENRFEYGRLLSSCRYRRATCERLPEILRERPSAAISEAAMLVRRTGRGRLNEVEAAVWAEFGRLHVDSFRNAARLIAERGVLDATNGRHVVLQKPNGQRYSARGIRNILMRIAERTK